MIALDFAIILVLIGINGLLAMSEMAVVSSRSHRLQQKADSGDGGAATALVLAQQPTRFLSTVQIGITLVAIVSGAFGGARLGRHFSPLMEDLGLGEGTSDSAGVILAVALITYLSLVLGEIAPKRVALHSPEAVASLISRPMQLLSTVGAPFVAVLSFTANGVLRALRLQGTAKDSITEEEVRLMISMSASEGSLTATEAALLERVFHFGDHQVHDAMTPRNVAVGVRHDATIADFYTVYLQAPHSRFPVYQGDLDHVVGILGLKDVMAALSRREVTENDPIAPIMREPLFVPETKQVDELFREMQASRHQIAIAVDEFGGTAGIVTLEQLLEEMVGQVGDELEPPQEEIREIHADTFAVSGELSIGEAVEAFGIEIPEGNYDTLAGYVLELLGHIPTVGESIIAGKTTIEVIEMRDLKIEQLRITPTLGSGRPE